MKVGHSLIEGGRPASVGLEIDHDEVIIAIAIAIAIAITISIVWPKSSLGCWSDAHACMNDDALIQCTSCGMQKPTMGMGMGMEMGMGIGMGMVKCDHE